MFDFIACSLEYEVFLFPWSFSNINLYFSNHGSRNLISLSLSIYIYIYLSSPDLSNNMHTFISQIMVPIILDVSCVYGLFPYGFQSSRKMRLRARRVQRSWPGPMLRAKCNPWTLAINYFLIVFLSLYSLSFSFFFILCFLLLFFLYIVLFIVISFIC